MSKLIHHVSDYTEYSKLTKESPCVVKFTASWCGPCKRIAPQFEQLAIQHSSEITFLEIDIDVADQITNHEDVQGIPLFLFYKDGKKRDTLTFKGASSVYLEANMKTFVAEVGLYKLALDDVVEFENEDSSDEDVVSEQVHDQPHESSNGQSDEQLGRYDSDENHNEYGEECEIIIEKTISDDMIKDE